jgi:ATP/maltotriose-dependent transcriptional regulator MalT
MLLEFNAYKEAIAAGLEGLATLEAGQGTPCQAAWLWGAAHALCEAIAAPMYPVYRANYEQAMTLARAQLGEQAFGVAWAEGRLMTEQQALAAQEQEMPPTARPTDPLPPPAMKSSTFAAGLTARELEVLRLLAQGRTDDQIAEHLVISPRTSTGIPPPSIASWVSPRAPRPPALLWSTTCSKSATHQATLPLS